MSARMSRAAAVNRGRVAGLAAAVCATAAIGTLVFLVAGPGRSLRADLFGGVGGASFVLLSLAYAGVGAVVAARVPENPIGWVFCAYRPLLRARDAELRIRALRALRHRPPARRCEPCRGGAHRADRGPARAHGAALPRRPPALASLAPDRGTTARRDGAARRDRCACPGRLDEPFATVSSPLGVPGWRRVMDVVNVGAWFLVVVGTAAAAVSVAVRLRRARGVERQQLKLVLAVGV